MECENCLNCQYRKLFIDMKRRLQEVAGNEKNLPNPKDTLTVTEYKVLRSYAKYKSTKKLSNLMNKSEATVEAQLKSIGQKLGIRRETFGRYALITGVITDEGLKMDTDEWLAFEFKRKRKK